MNDSFLIGIALNKFEDESISKLQYSQFDCLRVQRAANILYEACQSRLIFDHEATRSNILAALKENYSLFDNLFIYISSHGAQKELIPYIFCYDTKQNNLENTALSLKEILNTLTSSQAKKITLIIDACQMPFKQKTINNIRILAPGKAITNEDSYFQQSLFSKMLLQKAAGKNLSESSANSLTRYQRIRKQVFCHSLKQNCLYLSGKAAIGKSHFLRALENSENHTFYISIPRLKSISLEFVLTLLSEKISFEEAGQWIDRNALEPEKYLRFYTTNNPHSTLVIDHFDHLDEDTSYRLYEFLNELSTTCLLATRNCPDFVNKNQRFEFPELTPQDVHEFIQKHFSDNPELFNAPEIKQSKDYISLLSAIHLQTQPKQTCKTNNELKKTCKAIAITGGFIRPECFSKHFQIRIEKIKQLIKQGLINQHKQFFYPHDLIYEEKISTQEIIELKDRARSYWKEEVLHNELHPKALHHYILLLDNFEFCWDEAEAPFYQLIATRLKGRQNSFYLMSLYNYLSKHNIPDGLRLSISEALLENGRFEEASGLIQEFFHKKEFFGLITELLWWQGQFQSCIEKSTLFLSQTPPSRTKILCSRGIGYFFIGRWPEASNDLNEVIQQAPIEEEKERCLAFCVLATIQGLRGTDFPNSVKNFIEAIKIARQAGQIAWIALIYDNIGEMFWKSGFTNEACETLKTGEHLAYLTDNEAQRLDINRNLLHALHRNKDFKASQQQLKILEEIMNEESENYVKMQIINSVLTHCIFFQKDHYQRLIPEAIKLTENNDEYSIYTLSNLALVALIETETDKAIQLMEQALTLCQKGENWLAMKQCLDDWDTAIRYHHLHQPLSARVFQKWHQVIQTKLLPYLHHLEDLSAFLQLH